MDDWSSTIIYCIMSEFYKQEICPYDKCYSVIIEDNSRVSYAYLLKDKSIISDVWLYNQISTPDKTNWKDRDKMPFLNPREYILEGKSVLPIEKNSDVNINWMYQNDLDGVTIFIRGEPIAVLKPKLFPGYSLLVCKDGPLAKKWE